MPFIDARELHGNFAKQEMRARQLRIDRQRFLELGFGGFVKLDADHHLGGEHVRCR